MHRVWLRSLVLGQESDRIVFADYLLAIEQLEQRLQSLALEVQQPEIRL